MRPGQPARATVRLFLAGDVMTGRGIDQLFATPSEPALREAYLHDARQYVALAEEQVGPIARPVPPSYVWGELLDVLGELRPDVRLVNLETSITTADAFWPGKGIHYRMHPANVGVLGAASVDVAVLANNHVLDFGRAGLAQTLRVLHAAGVATAGAGLTREDAEAPAIVERGGARVLVAGLASPSSGVFEEWRATDAEPGVAFVSGLTDAAADATCRRLERVRRAGDVAVVSIHWGPNWGYAAAPDERRFAHRLVDGGVDVVHGHSSHHPRELEVYRGKLVLYGCGDLVSDYEGLRGWEQYRPNLRPAWFADVDVASGELVRLECVAVVSRALRLVRADDQQARWLAARLTEISHGLTFAARGATIVATAITPGDAARPDAQHLQ